MEENNKAQNPQELIEINQKGKEVKESKKQSLKKKKNLSLKFFSFSLLLFY